MKSHVPISHLLAWCAVGVIFWFALLALAAVLSL
jgi:hypothetical protein